MYAGRGSEYDRAGVKCDGSTGAISCAFYPDTGLERDRATAIAAWNTRTASTAPLIERVKALEAIVSAVHGAMFEGDCGWNITALNNVRADIRALAKGEG